MACDTASETYLSLLEDNHWTMVKTVDPEVFLDYMRQHRVMSEEDCQTIQNYFVHPTRRARMRKSSHTTAFLQHFIYLSVLLQQNRSVYINTRVMLQQPQEQEQNKRAGVHQRDDSKQAKASVHQRS